MIDGQLDSDAPKRGKIRGRGNERTKELNENLAPLANFLDRRVGLPWNRVYSEIRAVLRVNSAVQLHVLQHLKQYVDMSDTLDKVLPGWWYVDGHGILRRAPRSKRWRPPQNPPSPFVTMSDGANLWRDRGIWYQLFEEDAEPYRDGARLIYRGTCLLKGTWSSGAPFRVVVRKKQLSWKELQRYGLSND